MKKKEALIREIEVGMIIFMTLLFLSKAIT